MPNGAPEAKLQPLEGATPLNLPHFCPTEVAVTHFNVIL